jgi:hypothetical protein
MIIVMKNESSYPIILYSHNWFLSKIKRFQSLFQPSRPGKISKLFLDDSFDLLHVLICAHNWYYK